MIAKFRMERERERKELRNLIKFSINELLISELISKKYTTAREAINNYQTPLQENAIIWLSVVVLRKSKT